MTRRVHCCILFIAWWGGGGGVGEKTFFPTNLIYIHPCNLLFLLNFISILVSILDFLGSFQSLLGTSEWMEASQGRTMLAGLILTRQHYFLFSVFLSSEGGIYHLCYRGDKFGSRYLQMQSSGMFPTLTSGVQLAYSQLSFPPSWDKVIVVSVNYALALRRKE